MFGQALQVQHLHPQGRQAAQDLGLARPRRPVEDQGAEARGRVVEPCGHLPAIGAVAAGQHPHAPADLGEDVRHGARAHAAPPAVDQGPEGPGLVRQGAQQVGGDVAGHVGAADLAGQEAGLLDVQGSHLGPLVIVEDRQVHCAGDVVFRELAGAAHVDDHVEARPRRGVGGGDGLGAAHAGRALLGDRKSGAQVMGRWYTPGPGQSEQEGRPWRNRWMRRKGRCG